MKKIHSYIILVSIFLLSFAFTCEEKCLGNSSFNISKDKYFIKTSNTTFNQNDTLWLQSKIPVKIKNLDGFTHEIKTNGFYHNISTKIKTNFNTYSYIDFGNFIIPSIGNSYNSTQGILSNYIKKDAHFEFKFGLILKQKGSYKLETEDKIQIYGNEVTDGCDTGGYHIPLEFDNNTTTFNFVVN